MKMNKTNLKLQNLKRKLKNMNSALIAFSGGVDSTFLLRVAYDVLGNNVIAVTAKSETYPKSELKEAIRLAKKIGVKHVIIDSEETDIKGFKDNTIDRCYYCKKELFSKLKDIAKKNRIKYVLDASNYDDINDFRPGMEAAEELKIKSPLKESRLTKDDIRLLSKNIGLDTWNKPSFACLASRFPYGNKITKEKLRIIEKAESYLRKLGVNQLRVRHHNKIARIEVGKKDFSLFLKNSDKINNQLKKFGFDYVTLDLKGYRTGSMNEVIWKKKTW